jgi:hypothetical protein
MGGNLLVSTVEEELKQAEHIIEGVKKILTGLPLSGEDWLRS